MLHATASGHVPQQIQLLVLEILLVFSTVALEIEHEIPFTLV